MKFKPIRRSPITPPRGAPAGRDFNRDSYQCFLGYQIVEQFLWSIADVGCVGNPAVEPGVYHPKGRCDVLARNPWLHSRRLYRRQFVGFETACNATPRAQSGWQCLRRKTPLIGQPKWETRLAIVERIAG